MIANEVILLIQASGVILPHYFAGAVPQEEFAGMVTRIRRLLPASIFFPQHYHAHLPYRELAIGVSRVEDAVWLRCFLPKGFRRLSYKDFF